jgi:hypothetical protein
MHSQVYTLRSTLSFFAVKWEGAALFVIEKLEQASNTRRWDIYETPVLPRGGKRSWTLEVKRGERDI